VDRGKTLDRAQAKLRVAARGIRARIKGAPWGRIGSAVLAAGVIAGLVVPVVHAAGINSNAAAVWLTAQGVALAVVALLAAAAAAVFAYKAAGARPEMRTGEPAYSAVMSQSDPTAVLAEMKRT
jgi:hypothetical protein